MTWRGTGENRLDPRWSSAREPKPTTATPEVDVMPDGTENPGPPPVPKEGAR